MYQYYLIKWTIDIKFDKIYLLSLLHKIFKVNIIILYHIYMYIFSEGKNSLHLCSENSIHVSISYCYG